MRRPPNVEPPARELARNLAKINLFYLDASTPIIGPKPIAHERLAVLREAAARRGVQLKTLQKTLRCSAFNLSRIARWLEKKEWAQIERDLKDGRARILSATAEGRALIRRVDSAIEDELVRRMPDSANRTYKWRSAIEASKTLNGALQEWIF